MNDGGAQPRLPSGVGQAKAFSNLATATLGTAADQTPRAVLPYLADSAATAHRMQPVVGAERVASKVCR